MTFASRFVLLTLAFISLFHDGDVSHRDGGSGCFVVAASAFVTRTHASLVKHRRQYQRQQQSSTSSPSSGAQLFETSGGVGNGGSCVAAEVEAFLKEEYSQFYELLLSKNQGLWKKLRGGGKGGDDVLGGGEGEGEVGCTIFALVDDAFAGKVGEVRCKQLVDPRNAESVEKMASYHIVPEPVTAGDLFDSSGVITLGGPIPVDRTVSGGFLGSGGTEDGGVTINGAKLVQSVQINDDCIVHEVDDLVSPSVLWRYCDQLRIPGSS